MINFYDAIIEETLAVLGGAGRCFPASAGHAWQDVKLQPLILEKEAALELGRPPALSVEYTLMSEIPLAGGDQVRLIGPELSQLCGTSGCFGKIVLLQVDGIGEEDPFSQIKRIEHMKYRMAFDGYMTRISTQQHRENIRISKEAVRRGISLERIGCAMIREYRKSPLVKGAQVIFLTEDQGCFEPLLALAKRTSEVTDALNKLNHYFTMDCQHCGIKPVCDAVEGIRELHKRQLPKTH